MEFELTKEQYIKIWDSSIPEPQGYSDRITYWKQHIKPKYKIDYVEHSVAYNYGWFGLLRGEEKDINWFLLQL